LRFPRREPNFFREKRTTILALNHSVYPRPTVTLAKDEVGARLNPTARTEFDLTQRSRARSANGFVSPGAIRLYTRRHNL